jgi:two-component system, sensor histidine kinase ChiS
LKGLIDMPGTSRKKSWALLAAVVVFGAFLIALRLLWLAAFSSTEQPSAINGLLDLRDEEISSFRTVSLDGEWEFYPQSFKYGEYKDVSNAAPRLIQVPGGWNDEMNEDAKEAYGYGTYRLRVLLSEENPINYSLRVPSVRSSSELYVNGRKLMQSGKPATDEQLYHPWNIPYTASFTADGKGEIEIVIQAANFRDPRSSGIVRSIKFGLEPAIAREVQLSVSMQLLVSFALLMHGAYAFLLYLLGNREKRLLYYSMLSLLLMAILVLSSEEKLAQAWFLVPYDLSFKLLLLFIFAAVALTFVCFGDQLAPPLRKRLPILYGLCIACSGLSLVVSVRENILLQAISSPLVILSFALFIKTIFKSAKREMMDNLPVLFSVLAVVSHLVWWTIMLLTGIKVIYYPFDLIFAIGGFVAVWFKKYLNIHFETRRLAVKLQRADKQKDEFLANTSHELRNPLHGILNISQAVLERERGKLGDKSVKDLGTVLTVGRRMSFMLNDLLDVMQLKEGMPKLHMKAFFIQSLAAGIFDMVRYMTESKAVRLENRIPDHMPQVWGDENRVVQIIFNLVHNAAKFTGAGEIAIQADLRHGRVYIEVTDTGIGMDEETVRRIFEPYEQGDSGQSMVEGGFGLGLSISKQLAELHGGRLEASSVVEKGSSFRFSLPVANPEKREEADLWMLTATEAAVTEAAVTSTNEAVLPHEAEAIAQSVVFLPESDKALLFNQPRVLVVDDDPVNRSVLETLLSGECYEVNSVGSADQALEALEKQEWDLVISDVMMPQMSGYELTRRIRERYSLAELPVLLLTARTRPEDIQEGFRSGANDYVSKPVEATELRSRVRMLTEVKQSVREKLGMEAAWLQAQIQPHFLFNALNAISALSEIDTERMRRMLDELSQVLRHKFRTYHINELVPIEEELGIVQSYLYIEQIRFEDRLSVEWEVEAEDCLGLHVPPLTIQPLVENAIKHGIMERGRGGKVTIRVAEEGEQVRITIKDDGVGMSKSLSGPLPSGGFGENSGVGLLNTDLRLKRQFGAGLLIESSPGNGTSVSFTIHVDKKKGIVPKRTHQQNNSHSQ